MKLAAKASRDGAWWAVECPEIRELYTQAKRLESNRGYGAKDAASLLPDRPEEEV